MYPGSWRFPPGQGRPGPPFQPPGFSQGPFVQDFKAFLQGAPMSQGVYNAFVPPGTTQPYMKPPHPYGRPMHWDFPRYPGR